MISIFDPFGTASKRSRCVCTLGVLALRYSSTSSAGTTIVHPDSMQWHVLAVSAQARVHVVSKKFGMVGKAGLCYLDDILHALY